MALGHGHGSLCLIRETCVFKGRALACHTNNRPVELGFLLAEMEMGLKEDFTSQRKNEEPIEFFFHDSRSP